MASKFLWPMEPPHLSRSVSNLAQILLSIPYSTFIIVLGITMHYNAFFAVLFLRVDLYGPQNFVSFKKFTCTDGLGSMKQLATSCTVAQVILFEKYELLRDSKKHHLKLNIALRESSEILATSFNFSHWTRKLT